MSVSSDSVIALALFSACSRDNSAPLPSRTQSPRKQKQRAARVVLFTDALLKYVILFAPQFTMQVKSIIRECTRRNRMGDQSFSPLSQAIMLHVRRCIGEQHWQAARSFYKSYLAKKKSLKCANKQPNNSKGFLNNYHQKVALSKREMSLQAALYVPPLPRESFHLGGGASIQGR